MSDSSNAAQATPPGAESPRPRTQPDVRSIMADIRARVRADVEKYKLGSKPLASYKADVNQQASRSAGELLQSEDLRYLNRNHDYAAKLRVDSITSHRKGLLGKLLVKAKQKFLRMLRYSLLKDYFASEAEFHVNLVRYLNDATKYIDARDGSIFWELIRKVDYDITKAMNRIEQLADQQNAELRSAQRETTEIFNGEIRNLSQRLAHLEGLAAGHADRLETLDSVARGLEGLCANLGPGRASASPPAGAQVGQEPPDLSYLLLENRFRGSQEEIAKRLAVYPEIFRGVSGRILDVGSGRGELLELFKQAGIDAYGVDSDAAMVEETKSKGLECTLGDGISHLAALPDRALGGLVAVQVVEHLSATQLRELFGLCAAKISSGGVVAFETVNPQSLSALSSNYFRDPTHVFPLHPDTLAYALTLAGLDVVETKFLSPFPKEAQLRRMPFEDFMSPRWRAFVELMNHNIGRLNDLLYGCQDFCVIARVR